MEGNVVEHLRVPNDGVAFLDIDVFGQKVEGLGRGRDSASAGLHVPDGGAVGTGFHAHVLPALNDPCYLGP